MGTNKKQPKPIYGVILFVFFSILSILFFIYKDKIIDNTFGDINADARKQLETYVEAPAVVVSRESEGGRRSRTVFTIQFRDEDNVLHTSRLYENALYSTQKGDTIKIYYDPENPMLIESEIVYKEIMRK